MGAREGSRAEATIGKAAAPPRATSASCRQRAYERRLLEQRKQAEADQINAAEFPAWAGRENVPAYVVP
jgi:hypothetical protein